MAGSLKPFSNLVNAHHPTNSLKPVVLKGGEYFVLGDNRPQSNDSRNWGPLPVESILGRAVVAGP